MGARGPLEGMLDAVAFALALSSGARTALAREHAQITLDWHAPAECPDQPAELARVEQLLGDGGAGGSALDVRAFVTLLLDGRFRAELHMVQGDGERTRVLEAPTCTAVAEASAAVVALASTPTAASVGVRSAPAPAEPGAARELSVQQPPTSMEPATGVASRNPARRESFARAIEVGAGVAADFGAVATPAFGATVLGGVRYGKILSFRLRASFFPERGSRVPSEPDQGVDILLVAAGPLTCFAVPELPVEAGACVEFELGYIHASGFGPPPLLHSHKAASWLAPGAGLTVAFPKRGKLRTRASADALFPLTRTEFVLLDVGTAHRLPAVAPRVGLYLELAFP